jgi:hypothetical protein
MRRGHVGAFLRYSEVEIVAICDVVAERRDHSLKTVEDFISKQKD